MCIIHAYEGWVTVTGTQASHAAQINYRFVYETRSLKFVPANFFVNALKAMLICIARECERDIGKGNVRASRSQLTLYEETESQTSIFDEWRLTLNFNFSRTLYRVPKNTAARFSPTAKRSGIASRFAPNIEEKIKWTEFVLLSSSILFTGLGSCCSPRPGNWGNEFL